MSFTRFVQTFLWCFFVWRVKYPSEASMFQEVETYITKSGPYSVVICTHDVGHSKDGVPGIGNERLGEIVRKLHDRFPTIPILPQLAVAKAIPNIPIAYVIRPPDLHTSLKCSTLGYNTYSVCLEQRDWCLRCAHGPPLVLVITTPDHMPRTLRVMRKVGFENVISVPLDSYRQKDYLDTNAQYFLIRLGARIHPWFYRLNEVLARLVFLLKGWL